MPCQSSSIQVFEFDSQKVRTVTGPDGDPWFVAADVCAVLGIANSRDALSRLDDDEKGVGTTDTLGGPQQSAILSESGVWALTFRSRQPAARRFRKWVTKEVIPAIRKTGAYVVPMPMVREAVAKLFVRPTLGAWAKRFPDEFYWHIYRMRGWTWRNMEVNHPQAVATYTIDFVYERLAPGLLEELERRNPSNAGGNRKARHHQFLTESIGHPALERHLYAVLSIMRASMTWGDFTIAMDRFHPRQGRNLMLALVDDLLPAPRF
ncbi:P63C domain-containing protein [Corallococcus sp. AB030]|uniref:P63C domain-containing protein n=1 Tax=Corallococcus sp. AB030 TaxID=2316716 RepID=UPI001EEEB9F1|nr:P63C domain-containing protein [Corallococcus sp. AB030]